MRFFTHESHEIIHHSMLQLTVNCYQSCFNQFTLSLSRLCTEQWRNEIFVHFMLLIYINLTFSEIIKNIFSNSFPWTFISLLVSRKKEQLALSFPHCLLMIVMGKRFIFCRDFSTFTMLIISLFMPSSIILFISDRS